MTVSISLRSPLKHSGKHSRRMLIAHFRFCSPSTGGGEEKENKKNKEKESDVIIWAELKKKTRFYTHVDIHSYVHFWISFFFFSQHIQTHAGKHILALARHPTCKAKLFCKRASNCFLVDAFSWRSDGAVRFTSPWSCEEESEEAVAWCSCSGYSDSSTSPDCSCILDFFSPPPPLPSPPRDCS